MFFLASWHMHGSFSLQRRLVTVIAVNISRIANILGSLGINEEAITTELCTLENIFIVKLQILEQI